MTSQIAVGNYPGKPPVGLDDRDAAKALGRHFDDRF